MLRNIHGIVNMITNAIATH